MQKHKIVFKNNVDLNVLDNNFYNILFEQILNLHKKT